MDLPWVSTAPSWMFRGCRRATGVWYARHPCGQIKKKDRMRARLSSPLPISLRDAHRPGLPSTWRTCEESRDRENRMTSPELRSPGQPTGTPPRPASERQMISSFEHQLSKATQTGTADGQLRRRRTKPTAYQRGQAGRTRVQQHTQEGLGAEAGSALCCRVTKKLN